MKRYIRSSTEPQMLDEFGEYSQEYLEYLSNLYYNGWEIKSPEARYALASIFTEDFANENNYYLNSIGFWEVRKSRPRREPDHVSLNKRELWRNGRVKNSSEYWYTSDGIIRGSDHWGSDVASCSWYLKGESYGNYGVKSGYKTYAYIRWEDLKAKGFIVKHWQTGEYSIRGFKFER